MATLRLGQHAGGGAGRYRVEMSAEVPGLQPLSTSVEFSFVLTVQEREEVRWYLEDFLEFDEEPAPTIARGIEQRMGVYGEGLFQSIFRGSEEAREIWTMVRPHLSDTRIEVTTDIVAATAIPWELMQDPKVGPLALRARALVRTHRGGVAARAPAQAEAGKVRILLVICRPKGTEDVPFRSVASRLVKGLSESARESFDLKVLRPPTYEQLARELRQAKEKGQPYHIVHFDGHGVYADPASLARAGKVLSSLRLDAVATGSHGYLMFEAPKEEHNATFVDGVTLGRLLGETAVSLLVLNACQSAFAQASAEPRAEAGGDSRSELAAYGSLAQEVIDAGTAGVVAMRYSVYVVTAAQFVAELYGGLAQGRTPGEAVTGARKNLADNPQRQVAYDPRPLQDWSVPVVYERTVLRLWPERRGEPALVLTLNEATAGSAGSLDRELPARPDVGFYGRDETLYALDRAFDNHRIVLLHAYAGSGKTSTAAEFARWYAMTGGIDGPVLFSTFQQHLPLARVLDKIGQAFGPRLENAGVQWDAITDPQERRSVTLQVLSQVPVLWIWDNVEPVTGFPRGTPSDWSAQEQRELVNFLRAARETQAKFLLTSRREERDWLGDLPVRVPVPPMPMRERLQLAGGISERHGERLAALPDLRPLLEFTRGNPLTILVTVRQALRDGIENAEKLNAYVQRLRSGEAAFQDEAEEGRSKSLGASLSYGFQHAFNEEELKILALLHLFQGFVDVSALGIMGNPDNPWCLEAMRGSTREHLIALLDRAAEVGHLQAHDDGYYSIHPALPWYFRSLFERFFPLATGDEIRAAGAFVAAISTTGNYYHDRYAHGQTDILHGGLAEEANLLAAWRLARANAWWDFVIPAMQGLRFLYQHTGRRAAWRRLVDEILPDIVDVATDGPRPGMDERWELFTEYRAHIAMEDRDWDKAERLQRARLDWNRARAEAALAALAETWDDKARNTIRSLAVSLQALGRLQCERGEVGCVESFGEALDLAQRIQDTAAGAGSAFNLGNAYLSIPTIRDFDAADRWYRRYLELTDPDDRLGQGRGRAQLGTTMMMRFEDARDAGGSQADLSQHLNAAANLYCEALRIIPDTAVSELAVTHNQLGLVNAEAGDIDGALGQFRQSICYEERQGNLFGAAETRRNIALLLARVERFADARTYAEAALNNFETFGERAAVNIQDTQQLLASIERDIHLKGG